MKSIRSSLWCSSQLNLKHIKNDICKSFAFQVCRGTHGKKTSSKVSGSSHSCTKSFYPPRLLVRKLKKKTQTKFVKHISTHTVGRKQESGDITREPPRQNDSVKSKIERARSKNGMSQDASCHSIPTYLFSNFSLPTFSDLENSFSIFSNSSDWKTAEDKDLNVEMCMDLGVEPTEVSNNHDMSYRKSLLDLINNNEKPEEKEVKSNCSLIEPPRNLQAEVDYCIVEEKLLGSTPSDVIWKNKNVCIGPAVGTELYPPSDVKMTIVSADRPKHYWNRASKTSLMDEDVEKIQEKNIPLFTSEPEILELNPCPGKLENISLSSVPENSECKPYAEREESISLMTPIVLVPCTVKEGDVTLVTPNSKINGVTPGQMNSTESEPNIDQEQFNPTSIVSIMNMIKDTDQMICSDSNSFEDFLKKGPIEKLPVSSPEPTNVLNILNSVDKSAVIIQNDRYVTNRILDTLKDKGNEMNKAKDKLKTTSRDFLKFSCGMNEKLDRLKENYENFKKETNGVEQELTKLDNSLNDDLLLLTDKYHLPLLKKATEQVKEGLESKTLSNTDFTLLDNNTEKNLLHLISKSSKNNIFNDNAERESEQLVFDNNALDENMLLLRNNENDQVLADTNNVQLSCQGLNSFSCSPSQKITINQSRQSHDSAKKSQEGKLNVDVATKTVISSSSKASGSEISIVEVQKFTDKRLPFPFSTETVLQVFGTKEKLTDALSVIEQSKAKVAVLNSSDGHKKGNQVSPAFQNMLTSIKSFDEKKVSPIPLIIPVDVVNSVKPLEVHPLSSELLMRQAKHAELVKLARSISASNKAMKIAFTNKPKRIVIRKNQNKTKKTVPKVDNERRPFKESVEKVKIIGPKQIDLILGLSPKESVAKRKSAYFQSTGTKRVDQQVKMNDERNVTERIKDVEKSQNQPVEQWVGRKNHVTSKPVMEIKPTISTTPKKIVDAKMKALVTLKAEEEDGLSLRDRTILKDILDGKYGYQNALSNKLSRESISTSSNVKKGSSSGKGNGDEPTDDAKMSKMLIEKIKNDSCGPILGNREAIRDCETKTVESVRSKSPTNNNNLTPQNHEMGNLKTSDLNKKAKQNVKNEPTLNKAKPIIQKVAANIMTNLKKQSSTSNMAIKHVNDVKDRQKIAVINPYGKQPSKQEVIVKPGVGVMGAQLSKPELIPIAQTNSGDGMKAHELSKMKETVKPGVKQFVESTLQSDAPSPQKEFLYKSSGNVKVSVFIPNSSRPDLIKNSAKVEKKVPKEEAKILANKTAENPPLKYNKVLFVKPNSVAKERVENQDLSEGQVTHDKKLRPYNYAQIYNPEVVKPQPAAKTVAHEVSNPEEVKPQTAAKTVAHAVSNPEVVKPQPAAKTVAHEVSNPEVVKPQPAAKTVAYEVSNPEVVKPQPAAKTVVPEINNPEVVKPQPAAKTVAHEVSNPEVVKPQPAAKTVAYEVSNPEVVKPQPAAKTVVPEINNSEVVKPQPAAKTVVPEINNSEVVKPQPAAKTVAAEVSNPEVVKPQLAAQTAAPNQLKKPQTAPTDDNQSFPSKLGVSLKNLKDEIVAKNEGKRIPMKHSLLSKLPQIKPLTSVSDMKKQALLKAQATTHTIKEKEIERNDGEMAASHAAKPTNLTVKDNIELRPDTVSHTPPLDLSHEFMFNFDKFSKETTPFLDPTLCKECLVAEHRILGFPMLNPAKTDYAIKQGVISIDIANNLMLKKQLKGIPSVTTILNSTMGDASKAALAKWRTTMINQLGEVGFKDFYKEQLKKGSDFHGSVHRYLKTLATGKAEETSSLTFKSVRDVLNNISDVSVLESQVIHSQLGYRGVVDCIARYKGIPVVIEWKRSDKPKPTVRHTFDAPLQLSAYIGALNYDKMYDIQVQGAMVVVAYSDGTKADVFNVNLEECKEYWKQWLGRFKSYILANQRFLSPIS